MVGNVNRRTAKIKKYNENNEKWFLLGYGNEFKLMKSWNPLAAIFLNISQNIFGLLKLLETLV